MGKGTRPTECMFPIRETELEGTDGQSNNIIGDVVRFIYGVSELRW